MKNICIALSFLFLLGCVSPSGLNKTWTQSGFKTPESVYFFAKENVLFVSNIDGGDSDKDGQGFISKLALDGKPIALKWVKGLHAPKGMAVLNGTLYVSDIDRLVAINIDEGKILKTYPSDARFLNDVVVFNGAIYSSDSWGNAVYKLEGDELIKWYMHESIVKPNGLDVANGMLSIGVSHGIFQVSEDRKSNHFIAHDAGEFTDGLKYVSAGKFVISDWFGRTWIVSKSGGEVILDTVEEKVNAADFEYIPSRNELIMPTFLDNRVVGYTIK